VHRIDLTTRPAEKARSVVPRLAGWAERPNLIEDLLGDQVKGLQARIAGDPSQAGRAWVLLTEAAEGGWGIAGTAFGCEEFAALLR
jgi:hypothetical protein